jgi:hypothetical protein
VILRLVGEFGDAMAMGSRHLFPLEEWWVQAEPAFCYETIAGTKKIMLEAAAAIATRGAAKYAGDVK